MYANYPKQNKGVNMLFLMIERKKRTSIRGKENNILTQIL